MKKILILVSLLLLFSSTVFCVESFWCLNATQNVQSSGDHYRFNYSTVFNLESYFNGTPKYSDYASSSNPNGALNESKAIGTVGVAGCSHSIKYTIIAQNNGRFVSQSDPSKYREYYVVNVPDYSESGSVSRNYYCHNSSGTGAAAPSTLGSNTMVFTAPVTDGKTNSPSFYNANGRSTTAKCASIGLDLFLCMKQLTNNDLAHISAADDYIATITVTWECTDSNCTQNHSGSFDIVVRGYYGNNGGLARDSFLMIVNPTADAMTLDLKKMIKEDQSKTISNIVVSTTTKEGTSGNAYEWRDHLHAFLSASPNYNAADTNGFVLTKMTNRSITIPYTLTVYNTTAGAPATGQTYDGKDYYTNSNSDSFYIDLKDYSKPSTNYYAMSYDRYGTYYYAINYTGRVEIKISNYTIPGSGNSLKAVMMDPVTYDTDYTKYIGKYESNIYYHIVYDD